LVALAVTGGEQRGKGEEGTAAGQGIHAAGGETGKCQQEGIEWGHGAFRRKKRSLPRSPQATKRGAV
jgi:hypothetical protein